MKINFCVPCLLGLEGLIADELREMGAEDVNAENGRVLLYCGDGIQRQMTVVPDLMYMTTDAANRELLNYGLNMKITGATNGSTATVISQSPAAGTEVEVGTIVEFELRYMDVTD